MISSINFGSRESNLITLEHPSLKDNQTRYTTNFFRSHLNWDLLGNVILNDFESDTPIYIGGCSDCSEVYSLKMLLKKKAPAKKFRFLAFDIAKENIDIAQKNIIDIWEKGDSFLDFKLYCREKIGNIVGHEIFNKNFIKIPGSEYKRDSKHSVNGALYQMTEHLKRHIDFQVADAVEFTKQKFEKPCVFLLRNFWPYLKPEKQKELAKNLKENLAIGSLVVIGEYDIPDAIPKLLKKNRFKLIDNNPMPIDDKTYSTCIFKKKAGLFDVILRVLNKAC